MLKTAVPILASLNTAETISYYTQKLGFNLQANWDGYLIFNRNDVGIHLWLTDNPEIPKNTGCYIYVSDVRTLYGEYQAHNIIHPNGKLELKPWKMLQFSVLDNNGNIIHFGESTGE
ncbi:hypothetical protein C8P68_105166 [Mucilaginibacter yixingensis]|uniref:Glyoxalase/fosfomycin resistance/dioxygenase domain-containing protein n=1 Tax=Mucilaginibacter yixingensis TaxID=1295612 RepID=A0A2T5J872_9SPHI|nr:VOC family protein [Mucilaginibacter yixingensis]PTQ95661.1 hypothetical protein C8P68_105166 [Mucilaginibacter yixingensis]